MQSLRLIGLFIFLNSCVSTTVPIQEYTIAKSAYEAALASESAKYAPQLFYKAEKAYKNAEKLYKEKDYSGAREAFLTSQKLSEKAENASRIKQFNTGEASDGSY